MEPKIQALEQTKELLSHKRPPNKSLNQLMQELQKEMGLSLRKSSKQIKSFEKFTINMLQKRNQLEKIKNKYNQASQQNVFHKVQDIKFEFVDGNGQKPFSPVIIFQQKQDKQKSCQYQSQLLMDKQQTCI